jgi:ankyrin repeat protein
MDERHVEELFLASEKGSVSFLTTLIQRDPLILSKVSLTSRRNTPLHIATLLGHLEFCKILLSQKPTFAQEVNDFGRTPLHLASAVGHTKIVQALLEANTQVCFVYDLDEKIPLHLAAMKGRKEIVQVLISARPESIQLDVNEESVLHLCVRYGQLDALKCLVESDAGKELLISKDRLGTSILDLAVMLKQKKVR